MDIVQDCQMVEELILDYACKNYMDDVISVVVRHRGNGAFAELNVPNLRVVLATAQAIVRHKSVAEYESALNLLGIVHELAPDVVTRKHYVKLTTGLKVEIMLDKLFQQRLDYADVFSSLNEFFPKSELRTSGVSEKVAELNAYQRHYRRLLTRLMLSKTARDGYRREEMATGDHGCEVIHLMLVYADKVNDKLPVPVLEQIIAEGPQSQMAVDLLDSQSDSLDQLMATSFNGPPSQEKLLAILTTAWDEESPSWKGETGPGNGEGDEGDFVSDTDIFDFPSPPASSATRGDADQPREPPAESAACPRDPDPEPGQVGPAADRPRDGLGAEEARPEGSRATPGTRSDRVAPDCPGQTSQTDCPSSNGGARGSWSTGDRAATAAAATTTRAMEEVSAASACSPGDGAVGQRDRPQDLRDSVPQEPSNQQSPVSSAPFVDSAVTGNTALSDEGVSPIPAPTLDDNSRRTVAPSWESSPLPETHATETSAYVADWNPTDSPSSLQAGLADTTPPSAVQPQESPPDGGRIPVSAAPGRPRETAAVPAAPSEGGSVPLVLAPSSLPVVSGSRIYLSKTGRQSKAGQRRSWQAAFGNGGGPLAGLAGVDPGDPQAGGLAKILKTLAGGRAAGDWEALSSPVSSLRVSSSSDSCGSLCPSDESGASVSLLSGMPVLGHGPRKAAIGWSPAMTALEEEMIELTMLPSFEDTIISDIEVYPVSRLKPVNTSRQRNRDNGVGVRDGTSDSQPVADTEPPRAEQDDTITSSSSSPVLHLEVGVQAEVGGRTPSPTPEEPPEAVARQAEGSAARANPPRPVSCPTDPEEAVPFLSMLSKTPVVRLRRLSEDPETSRLVDIAASSQSEASRDEVLSDSDSEESVVPDSEGEDSGWTSDSSSLPCIELRLVSDDCPIRRFPSLREFLTSAAEMTSRNYQMTECTVRLHRLKQADIKALTNGGRII